MKPKPPPKAEIIITVKGGIAYVVKKPKGVRVLVMDYDVLDGWGKGSSPTEAVYHEDSEIELEA